MPPRPKGHGKPKNIKQTVLRILSYIKGYRLLMLFAVICIIFMKRQVVCLILWSRKRVC